MAESAAATWTTHIRGKPVQLPATVAGIRATLRTADVASFDAEVARTPGQYLHRVLARWALPPEAHAEDAETVARLREGDFSGCVPQDDTTAEPPAGAV
ncbi:hypothetical protein [Streptomyces sp. NPDC050504]|uniref:hypothetical protein n=1 Tax=Streptomyces sp. NPDC050504 TaxID=3365618 RepID=UPI00378BEE55